jgi:hypothetical protein
MYNVKSEHSLDDVDFYTSSNSLGIEYSSNSGSGRLYKYKGYYVGTNGFLYTYNEALGQMIPGIYNGMFQRWYA